MAPLAAFHRIETAVWLAAIAETPVGGMTFDVVTVTVAIALSTVPHALVTRTKYVVVDDGLTVIESEVDPLIAVLPLYH